MSSNKENKNNEVGSEHEHDCGCGGGCGDGCGCDHDHEHHHQSVSLTLEDDTQLECPILDAFEINEQRYIALLHPEDETALLYRYYENDDDTIDIENIDSDEEFDLVSKTFLSLQED